MWCRVLLVATALTYVMCVLLLSGLQKEDLDVSLLKKLQRHNVNIDDMNNETVEKCLENVNSAIRKGNLTTLAGEVVSTISDRSEQTTPLRVPKVNYNYSETKEISKENTTETENSRNKYIHEHVEMANMINIRKLSDKTKPQGEETNTKTTINKTTLPYTKNVISLNEENNIDPQITYFDFINKMFKGYITAKQSHTSTPKPKNNMYQDQNIAEIKRNKNINPQNLTIDNIIYLWELFNKIKSQENDLAKIKIINITEQQPVVFNTTSAQKDANSQTKRLQYTNIIFESYVTTQRSRTVSLEPPAIQHHINITQSKRIDFLESNRNYHDKDFIKQEAESTESGNANLNKPHNTDDDQQLARKSGSPKHIDRWHEPFNASEVLQNNSRDPQYYNNSKTVEKNIVQKKMNTYTEKREHKSLPDYIIKEITENIKASVLNDLQQQMSLATMKITTANNTIGTTINKPIIAQEEKQNETKDFSNIMEQFLKLKKERVDKYTSVIISTSTNRPETVQDTVQNESTVYNKLMALYEKLTKESEHTTEMTTTNMPKIVHDKNLNETTVFQHFMELLQKYNKNNDTETTTDITSTSRILQIVHDKILAASSLDNFKELFHKFYSSKEGIIIPSDSKYTLTQKKNTKNEFHGPINVLYPSLLPVNYDHDVNIQPVSVMPIFFNPYPHVYQINTAEPTNSDKENLNSKTRVAMISGFKLNPVNNIASVIEDMPTILSAPILQTNADMIPPLGIPIPKTVKAINQNIVVTTKHPMKQFREDLKYPSDTSRGKHQDYMVRDYERYDTDVERSDADIERTHRAEFERSDGIVHRYTQRARSIPRQNKKIDRGHTSSKHRQTSDFDIFYKDYINNIKPHENRDYHPMLSQERKREKFHEKLERPDNRERHNRQPSNIPKDDARLKVASRQQMSFTDLKKRVRNNDLHFRTFLKTQQKVNDMLEKILATKLTDNVRSVETPETVHL